jgi:hypothetical protein
MIYTIYIKTCDGTEILIHKTLYIDTAGEIAKHLLALENVIEVRVDKKESE